jgi:hypothetical protein
MYRMHRECLCWSQSVWIKTSYSKNVQYSEDRIRLVTENKLTHYFIKMWEHTALKWFLLPVCIYWWPFSTLKWLSPNFDTLGSVIMDHNRNSPSSDARRRWGDRIRPPKGRNMALPTKKMGTINILYTIMMLSSVQGFSDRHQSRTNESLPPIAQLP